MPEVLIGGIEYVPRAEIPELSDARLEQALKILTAYLYFDSSSRPMAMVLNTIRALSPELAKLAEDDSLAAYERMHGVER